MDAKPVDLPECPDLTKLDDCPECPDLTKPNDHPECPDLTKPDDLPESSDLTKPDDIPGCPDLTKPDDLHECPDLTKPDDQPECPDLTKPTARLDCLDLAKIAINLQLIVDDIDATDLLDYFIQEEVLSDDDSDVVRNANPNTHMNRNLIFLHMIINSEPRTYDVFIQSLTRSKCTHVVDALQNTVLESHVVDVGKLLDEGRAISLSDMLTYWQGRDVRPLKTDHDP
jgi:hypothetical protein